MIFKNKSKNSEKIIYNKNKEYGGVTELTSGGYPEIYN